jgi:hypothetical protein
MPTFRSNQRREYVRNLPAERMEIKGLLVHSTTDAYKFHIDGWHEAVWIPASQTFSVHRERATTGYDRMIISLWIAKQKGIIT